MVQDAHDILIASLRIREPCTSLDFTLSRPTLLSISEFSGRNTAIGVIEGWRQGKECILS